MFPSQPPVATSSLSHAGGPSTFTPFTPTSTSPLIQHHGPQSTRLLLPPPPPHTSSPASTLPSSEVGHPSVPGVLGVLSGYCWQLPEHPPTLGTHQPVTGSRARAGGSEGWAQMGAGAHRALQAALTLPSVVTPWLEPRCHIPPAVTTSPRCPDSSAMLLIRRWSRWRLGFILGNGSRRAAWPPVPFVGLSEVFWGAPQAGS